MNPAANAGAKCAESVIPSLSHGEAHRICSISSNPLCTLSSEQQRQDACQSLARRPTGPACQWKAHVLWTADVKFGLTEMHWTQNCRAVTSRVYLKVLKDVFRVSFQWSLERRLRQVTRGLAHPDMAAAELFFLDHPQIWRVSRRCCHKGDDWSDKSEDDQLFFPCWNDVIVHG